MAFQPHHEKLLSHGHHQHHWPHVQLLQARALRGPDDPQRDGDPRADNNVPQHQQQPPAHLLHQDDRRVAAIQPHEALRGHHHQHLHRECQRRE